MFSLLASISWLADAYSMQLEYRPGGKLLNTPCFSSSKSYMAVYQAVYATPKNFVYTPSVLGNGHYSELKFSIMKWFSAATDNV